MFVQLAIHGIAKILKTNENTRKQGSKQFRLGSMQDVDISRLDRGFRRVYRAASSTNHKTDRRSGSKKKINAEPVK
jgi:hypothetical protein